MDWDVRDLGSRNGTFVNGRQLLSGQAVRIEVGTVIAFGDPMDPFELTDDTPPAMHARTQDGTIIYADDGVLALPSPDACECVIMAHDEPGRWVMEMNDGTRRLVMNQELVILGDGYWFLELPTIISPTQPTRVMGIWLDDIRLLFEIGDARERVVDITIVHASGRHRLPHRPNADLLLMLARRRLNDARGRNDPVSEHGWVEREELLDELGEARDALMTPERLSVEVYRARHQFRAAQVIDAERIIERRRSPPALRLGTDKIDILAPGDHNAASG